eukprot:428114_1
MSLAEKLTKLVKLLLSGHLQTYIKVGVTTMVVWFIWKNRARKHKNMPIRPGFLPIIGHLHILLGLADHEGMEEMDHMTKKVLQLNSSAAYSHSFAKYPAILLLDPKLIKLVFETQFEDFMKSEEIRLRLEPLLGDGIFSSDPPRWREHRKIGSKMFSMRNLKNYMFEVAKTGDIRLMNKIEQLRQKNDVIDIYNLFAVYTLDVFVEIAFGESLKIIESIPKPHPFSVAFDRALELIMWRFRNPLYGVFKYFQIGYEKGITKCMNDINRFADDMIKSVGSNASNTGKTGQLSDIGSNEKVTLLSLFMKHDPKLTTKDLRDIAMNFIIAGRDTTRITLSWFFYELSLECNKEVKRKVLEEVDNFYMNEEELTYENIQNHYDDDKKSVSYFKYTEACLLETLRLHAAVPILGRFAVRDVQLPGTEGHIIKKGTNVNINTYVHGRNTNVWGADAAVFKPERFISKGLNTFEPHVYPAFNLSPRLCLGRHVALMEAKLVAIRFLRKYEFEHIKEHKVEITLTLVLNMANGFKVRVTPRK